MSKLLLRIKSSSIRITTEETTNIFLEKIFVIFNPNEKRLDTRQGIFEINREGRLQNNIYNGHISCNNAQILFLS